MYKIRILKIISTVFRLSLIFSLSFIWMRYFFADLTISIVFAIFLTALVDLLLYTILRRKENKNSLKSKELKEAEDMFLSLLMDENPLLFFQKLASSKHKCRKFKDYILVSESDSRVALFSKIQLSFLTADEVVDIYKKTQSLKIKPGKIVVVTGTAEKEAYSVASKLDVNFLILNKEETYKKLYKVYEIYPKASEVFKPIKGETFKTLLAYSFNKKRTKAYLFAALILLFSAFIIGSNVYYVTMSSLLLIFALISYYNPTFNKKIENKIFQ